jgi:hypothetical protein
MQRATTSRRRRPSPAQVSQRGVAISVRPVLTEIYLCQACSCHAIEDGNARTRAADVAIVVLASSSTEGACECRRFVSARGMELGRADWGFTYATPVFVSRSSGIYCEVRRGGTRRGRARPRQHQPRRRRAGRADCQGLSVTPQECMRAGVCDISVSQLRSAYLPLYLCVPNLLRSGPFQAGRVLW